MREVRGAVSGMLMVAGLLYGYDAPGENDVNKKAHYRLVQNLAGQFREKIGSIICREILSNPPSDPNPTPRTSGILQDPSLRPYGHDCGGHSGRLHCGAPGHGASAMNDFIYNQHDIPKEQYRYGLRASGGRGLRHGSPSGTPCKFWGDKRTSRADPLLRMAAAPDPRQHRHLLLGACGVLPEVGFPVKIVVDIKRFDEAAKNADACILFYHWRSKCRFGAHFAALHHTEKGFIGYNTYRNSTGADNYGSSLADFLRKRKYFGAVLLAINRK